MVKGSTVQSGGTNIVTRLIKLDSIGMVCVINTDAFHELLCGVGVTVMPLSTPGNLPAMDGQGGKEPGKQRISILFF